MKLSNKELKSITGGNVNVTGALINSVSNFINTILGVGRVIGTSIRMGISGSRC